MILDPRYPPFALPSKKPRRRRNQPEQAIQTAVVAHLRLRGKPGLVFFHVPNGGARRPIEAAILKRIGVRAGVSDLILIYQGKIYALELKADGGRPTEAQLDFISDMNQAGAFACVCEGLDRAIAVLKQWGLVRSARGVAA